MVGGVQRPQARARAGELGLDGFQGEHAALDPRPSGLGVAGVFLGMSASR